MVEFFNWVNGKRLGGITTTSSSDASIENITVMLLDNTGFAVHDEEGDKDIAFIHKNVVNMGTSSADYYQLQINDNESRIQSKNTQYGYIVGNDTCRIKWGGYLYHLCSVELAINIEHIGAEQP